ncbi:MAG: T9SS type A sorting domain-containing protein [Bacteroidota bacterium]|nr:zinc-dependent metalloprotease [Bacteroidota bacterium]
MKFLLYTFIILLSFKLLIIAQYCSGEEIYFFKYVDGFPFGHNSYTTNPKDAKVIKWNNNKLNNDPIFLSSFDTTEDMPGNLIGSESTIASLFSQMITKWNNNYSLQLAINNNQDNVFVGFFNDQNYFYDQVTGGYANGRTDLPVILNSTSEQYEFYELVDENDGLVEYNDAVVFFNSYPESGITWTTSTTPVGSNQMLGSVVLHELGHVLSMGHIYNDFVDAIMRANYNPSSVTPSLKDCDKSNAAWHSEQLYGLVVGISNAINITSFPSLIDENQQYSLNANFYKGDPYSTDHVLSWNWIIKLYHENGTYEYVNETFSGGSYWYSCSWTLNTTTLPSGYNWTLNTNGHIATDIIASAQIAGDGVSPVTKIVSFNTEPTQPQNLTIAWYNNHPRLTWNTNLEEDIASYKIWKHAEGSSMIVATVTNNSNNDIQSWIDNDVTSAGKFSGYQFSYKVKAVDNTNKESVYSNEVSIFANGPIWKISADGNENNISTYKLFSNFPNPFNPSTNIEFQIPQNSFVNLSVYNSLGQKVTELINSNLSIGKYTVKFSADNLPSGLYIYKLQVGNFSSVKKMMLTK